MFKNFLIIIFVIYFFIASVFWPSTPLENWMNSFFNTEKSTTENLIINSSKISTPNSETGSITEPKDLTTKEYVDQNTGHCSNYKVTQHKTEELPTATNSIYCEQGWKIVSATCHKAVYSESIPSDYGAFINDQYLIEIDTNGSLGVKCASPSYYLPRIICCH